jgi:hypothetical protein
MLSTDESGSVAGEEEMTTRARNKANMVKVTNESSDRMDPVASSSGSGEIKT